MPSNAGAAPSRDEGGVGEQAPDFCALSHSLAFQATMEEPLPVGTLVGLVSGFPPRVFSGGQEVGVITDAAWEAIEDCLAAGYEMRGRIEALNVQTRVGQLRVRGRLK